VSRSGRRAAGFALLAGLLALAPAPGVRAQDATATGVRARDAAAPTEPQQVARSVFDLALMRPFGLLQVLVGAAVLPVAWPVGWATGGEDDVLRACIQDPVARTFRRPLGRLGRAPDPPADGAPPAASRAADGAPPAASRAADPDPCPARAP